MITIQISPGELVDRITILQIKKEAFLGSKRERAMAQFVLHRDKLLAFLKGKEKPPDLYQLLADLRLVNQEIWDAEDRVRASELTDEQFGQISRISHSANERRFQLKRKIDEAFGSELLEDKSYP